MTAAIRQQPQSLLEAGVTKLASVRSRKKRSPGTVPTWLKHLWWMLLNTIGTVLSMSAFVVGLFLIGPLWGFLGLGVAFLVLDYKITVNRRILRSRR